jgi:TIGR03009 family protein
MPILTTRTCASAYILGYVICTLAAAQQQVTPVQPTGQQPLAPVAGQAEKQPIAQAPAKAPPGFELNAIEDGMLNQVLDTWQVQSGKVTRFSCSFERLEYNAFSPKVNGEEQPLNQCKGELSYSQPDKGSFQITEIRTFKVTPPAPGQPPDAPLKGDWVVQPNAIGEHWVCDGKSVFEYRHQDKQLVERPIPAALQGKSIVDGPLPFLFGAERTKLRARYWLRIENQQDKETIWLTALPRFQEQAADYSKVEVMLDRTKLLPKAMRIQMPDGSRHVYIFDIANAKVNQGFAILARLFDRPRVPRGWKHVVEQAPVNQAANPKQQQR